MTRSTIDPVTSPPSNCVFLTVQKEDRRIARLAAAAVGLSLIDAAIPMPLPGVKPGLANIITLLALAHHGFRVAVWVSLLRIVASALVLGQFLAPGFFLALAGGLSSLLALGVAQYLPRRFFSLVSLSLCAGFAHIMGQLLLARIWLVPHDGIFRLLPVFLLAALVFGLINGIIALRLSMQKEPLDTSTAHETPINW
jgi:heptaprenyl diphosphate synthase